MPRWTVPRSVTIHRAPASGNGALSLSTSYHQRPDQLSHLPPAASSAQPPSFERNCKRKTDRLTFWRASSRAKLQLIHGLHVGRVHKHTATSLSVFGSNSCLYFSLLLSFPSDLGLTLCCRLHAGVWTVAGPVISCFLVGIYFARNIDMHRQRATRDTFVERRTCPLMARAQRTKQAAEASWQSLLFFWELRGVLLGSCGVGGVGGRRERREARAERGCLVPRGQICSFCSTRHFYE